jgi:uncharacterized membrane protein (UPF0127 family)
MKKRILFIAGVAFAAIIFSSAWYQYAHAPVHGDEIITLISPDGQEETVAVEIADDDAERARGLMNRDSLPAGTGMLFVFTTATDLDFWMKNTRIPLDILFFDDEGIFVSRTTMDPCITTECPQYASDAPARYALEVNRGEPLTADVGTGWMMERR